MDPGRWSDIDKRTWLNKEVDWIRYPNIKQEMFNDEVDKKAHLEWFALKQEIISGQA